MLTNEKILIRYEKGNIVRTYKGVDFFEYQEAEYTISSNVFFVYKKKRYNNLEDVTTVIENEILNKGKNGKFEKTK